MDIEPSGEHVEHQPVQGSVASPNGTARSSLRILGVVIVVQTVALVGLATGFALVSLRQQARFQDAIEQSNARYDQFFGMTEEMYPSAEEQEMYAKCEEVGSEVGYLLQDKDLEGYLALYREGDTSVDLEAAKDAFNRALQRIGEKRLDFWPEPMMMYEDEGTGETIARLTINGESMTSDVSTGVRLSVWVLTSDTGIVLTGNRGRDLKSVGSPYF